MAKASQERDLGAEILALVARFPQKSFKGKELVRDLAVTKESYLELRKTLRRLVQEGALLKLHKNRYASPSQSPLITGVLRVNSQGFGFVTRDDGREDVYVGARQMGSALHRDRVRVRLLATRQGERLEGQVVEIIGRGRDRVVGTFRWGRKYAYVIPDEIKIQTDIIVPEPEESGAEEGQKVVVAIDRWPSPHQNPEGHILQVLGYPGDPGVDVLSIVHGFNLDPQFPEEVEAAALRLEAQIPLAEYNRRLDCRDWLIFTIDPVDARDFDDAVSLRPCDNGHLELGVHIADVSHYVTPAGAIDREAERRGTSVYLVDRAIPMLPEHLSSQLCSLRQDEEKLCYSVLLELTPEGNLAGYSFHESIIRSRRRLTYEEAQALIDGGGTDEISLQLRRMWNLAAALIRRREQRGSIDFESQEVQVILDASGHPTGLRRRERLQSHRLIEEFMLLANETVARHAGQAGAAAGSEAPPFVYRVHEKPDRDEVSELLKLLANFGILQTAPKRITPHYFQKLGGLLRRHPAAVVLQDAMLRTMAKARYSTENLGHFGLAYSHYTHFTSPIRRYPDLLVHRLLKAYTAGHSASDMAPLTERLEEQCREASESEVRAAEAERASIKLKLIEYMEDHLGDEQDGFISRIVPFGIFVTLPEFLVEGLVHISDLEDDYYVREPSGYRLVGQRSGRVYALGDPVRIRITRVDRNERLIDFVVVSKEPGKGRTKGAKVKPQHFARPQKRPRRPHKP
ncbi:MAG TPA: ribonuclease R [bacterium]|nr:ribonuclease R [bacterium]HPR86421.1 ribonuclease R [bacterium]